MLKKEIKISVLELDDGDDIIQFQIEATNGIISTSIDFYGYADSFREFAKSLQSFPSTISDTVKFELGEIGNHWAYYILIEVFCYNTNGHTAIHVITDNNGKRPHSNKTEFFITTVPASLNKFGQLLNKWNPLEAKEIISAFE